MQMVQTTSLRPRHAQTRNEPRTRGRLVNLLQRRRHDTNGNPFLLVKQDMAPSDLASDRLFMVPQDGDIPRGNVMPRILNGHQLAQSHGFFEENVPQHVAKTG